MERQSVLGVLDAVLDGCDQFGAEPDAHCGGVRPAIGPDPRPGPQPPWGGEG